MFQICVIALVGLPSSGKTSFCRAVLKSSIDLNILHVCYDELFTFLPQTSDKTFKQERGNVRQHIEDIITAIICSKQPFENVSHWKQSTSNVFVILCDDNHYYAGMRYEIYKICRNHGLSFGQVYFPLDLDIALSRNSTRGLGSLPPEVVRKMSERLEAPSSKHHWEIDSLIIDGDLDLAAFFSFIQKCLHNPIKELHVLVEPQEKDSNPIHGLDLILRRKIKETLQCEGEDGDLCKRAKLLNERRKAILQETKNQPESDLDVDYLLKKLFL